jgi:hypothetical protein
MAHKPPPVPPAEKSHQSGKERSSESDKAATNPVPGNLREENRQGNIYQNTHNQGYQQDR